MKHREISEETLLRELRLEMETQRRLREIYQRKELGARGRGREDGAGALNALGSAGQLDARRDVVRWYDGERVA